MSSRRIALRSSSSSISGSYSLYDLLSIATQSGSISVHVTLQSASSNNPFQPATLELRSKSGSVRATLSEAFIYHHAGADGATDPPPPYSSALDADDDVKSDTYADPGYTLEQYRKDRPSNAVIQSGFPDREYITSVNTQSGSISGTFPLGARTGLESHSGSLSRVELIVVPVRFLGSRRLSTMSHSGSQSVRIVENCSWATEEAWWEGMLSKHESRSGSINVEYPDSWEGTIEVETESGSVSIKGIGVEIIREGRGRVVARKGKEGSGKVMVRSGSGKVDLRFG